METKFNKPVGRSGSGSGPSFFRYNRGKVLPFAMVSFAVAGVLVSFAAFLREDSVFSRSYGLGALIIGSLIFFVGLVTGGNGFWGVANLLQAGRSSIVPLFDNGYSIRREQGSLWFFFTSPTIEGVIDGFDVIVSHTPEGENVTETIHFDFFPVYGWPPDEAREMRLEVSLGRENRDEDVVKIVRDYTQKLIADGYTGHPRNTNHS